jgi:hypothetical protein
LFDFRLLQHNIGTERTSRPDRRMSALRGKAEVGVGQLDFRFGQRRTLCESKIAELMATLTPSLRLDHKVSFWYGYAPFQSVGNKFKNDLRI